VKIINKEKGALPPDRFHIRLNL
jgi:hypothetical protein